MPCNFNCQGLSNELSHSQNGRNGPIAPGSGKQTYGILRPILAVSKIQDLRLPCQQFVASSQTIGKKVHPKAEFSRVQDFGSKVEFLADVMCESWTVKVAIFSPNNQF